MELVVEPLNVRLNVDSGSNLLDVLRSHKLPVSYSCMSGRCGICRCRVLSGQLRNSGPEAGRPHSEKGEYALACQAVLTADCTIELPEAGEVVVHTARIVKGMVTAIEAPTHDIRRIRVKMAKPIEFTAGQYATVEFTPEHIRPYSMAGLHDDGEWEFHIRRVPDGRVSTFIFDELQVGTALRISGPLGTAYLRKKHTGPMLCVGGGTGLAPVLSIVRGALAADMQNPIHLYFCARSAKDVYDTDRLQDLAAAHPNVKVHIVVATGAAGAGQRRGLVTDTIKKDLGGALAGWRAYLCGTPAMVDAFSLLVTRMGIEPGHVHGEAFYPSGV